MGKRIQLADLFESTRYQKIILTVSIVLLLVLELLIYLGAASQAGEKRRVVVTDSTGKKVYETPGGTLTSYEKMVFESTFGPLNRYQVHVETEKLPFPFRAWLSAAVGIPVGLILLISFVVRAFMSLLYGDDERSQTTGPDPDPGGRFASLVNSFQRFSIFHVGALVLVMVLLFWMVPNFLGNFGKIILTLVREYKEFVIGLLLFLAALVVWVIYLKYRLSQQVLENQVRIEQLRLEHRAMIPETPSVLLPDASDDATNDQ